MKVVKQSHEIITKINREEILRLLELFGRTAYQSKNKIILNSASVFVSNLILKGHESVLEHISLTVKFITDRGTANELVRHRFCAFTQESTRYCNYAKGEMCFIKPVYWDSVKDRYECPVETAYQMWADSMEEVEKTYNLLVNNLEYSPQEARAILPNSLKTEIIVTTNLREWRYLLKLRTAKEAHPQMRDLMNPLLEELREQLPEIFFI
jgi:thymidylate synthase (FAD)